MHFGGYGFNKSHSTAYALVAYQTAYLKAHYPTEYMAAVLSSEMDGAERDKFFIEHIDDCRRMGIDVLKPNINEGQLDFRVGGDGNDPFWSGCDQGGRVQGRRGDREGKGPEGSITSLDDFFERVPTREVGAGCVETLIRAGAFDCLDARRPNLLRNQLLCVLPRAIQAGPVQAGRSSPRPARAFRRHRVEGPPGLEEWRKRPSGRHDSLPEVAEMSDADLLAGEKKALGFYLSSHPLTRHAGLLHALATHRVADLPSQSREKSEVILGGMITNIKERNVQKSRSGLTRMAKLTFEDLSGTAAGHALARGIRQNG